MKEYFDHTCHGSIELLQNRELSNLARSIRFGRSNPFDPEEEPDQFGEGDDF